MASLRFRMHGCTPQHKEQGVSPINIKVLKVHAVLPSGTGRQAGLSPPALSIIPPLKRGCWVQGECPPCLSHHERE